MLAPAGATGEGPEDDAETADDVDWMIWLEDIDFCPLMNCDPQTRTPGVRVAGARVMGSLARDTIQHYIREQRNQLRSCYERRLQHDPDLVGRVEVTFVISDNGQVASATVAESELGDPEVEDCVVDVFRGLTFPRPEGGGIYIITYPLRFQPSDALGMSSRT